MTRTYRMYVDQGISDRVLHFIRDVIPMAWYWGYAGRINITNVVRGPNQAYFDFEIIILADGTEIVDTTDPEVYYNTYAQSIKSSIESIQIDFELLFDSGRPERRMTHKYVIEPNLIIPKTHKFNLEEIVILTTTHKFNLE